MRFAFCLFAFAGIALAQSASLTGFVKDPQDALVPRVNVTLTNSETGVALTTATAEGGTFEFSAVRPGIYNVRAEAAGFQTFVQNRIVLPVDGRTRLDIALKLGATADVVTVEANVSAVQTESSNVGEVIETKKIVEIPLNGRFFLDLALLTPGTVVPSTNNRTFLAVPSGIGSSGINAAGSREDSTNYLFDGINLSDGIQNQITFQPNIDMIQEFKVQTNSFSAEYGRNAGIIVNGVSKSGSNEIHGSAYEFVRNDKFDAKNLFDRPGQPIPPFKRNIFGYSVGGPIKRGKTFFFHSYEGRQGRESVTLRQAVPSAAQRAAVTNPVVKKLLDIVPQATGGGFFDGAVPKRRVLNQFSGKIDHSFSEKNILSGTFISNRDERTEPNLQGNNLAGFGDTRPAKRALLALNYTRVLTPRMTNELRAGLNRVRIDFLPEFTRAPGEFGIENGTGVFPQFVVSGGLAFGGITGFPQGRGDTSFQYTDTLAWNRGAHSMKAGVEIRRFRNNNFNNGIGGIVNFASLTDFLNGTPSTVTQQRTAANPAMRVTAYNFFAQDDYKVNPRLTLNLGVRYEYNGLPNEKYNRLSVFDFNSRTLRAMGTDGVNQVYEKEYNNFGPRFGFSFDPTGKAKTVVRGGVGLYYDQPVVNTVTGLGSNPPFASSVTFANSAARPIDLAAPFNQPGGGPAILNANSIAPNFVSGYVEQYNLNVQHERFGTVFQAGYIGSSGRHLRLVRDFNQGIGGVRPITTFGQINIQESSSRSNYNALWISANRRFSKGLTFTTSYTFSKSIDLNSVGSSNPQVQDANNLRAERALSDFDARQRFVLSAVYLLPFHSGGMMKRIVEGWNIAPIVNLQSGNPFSPIAPRLNSGSLLAFDRPDVVAGQTLRLDNPGVGRWFNTAAFVENQRLRFGNAGRNIIRAPGFQDVDFALSKNTAIKERFSAQFRAEIFNLFNHPNLGQPVNSIASAQFGQILATRTVRGDLGSSRQLQLGLKLLF